MKLFSSLILCFLCNQLTATDLNELQTIVNDPRSSKEQIISELNKLPFETLEKIKKATNPGANLPGNFNKQQQKEFLTLILQREDLQRFFERNKT